MAPEAADAPIAPPAPPEAAPAQPEPSSSLSPGLPPAIQYRPVPSSPEEQSLLGAPRDDTAAARGLVQADPSLLFGIDAPDLVGFAVSAVRGFKYRASLRTEYSDNVAHRASDAPLPGRYVSRTDWRFTPEIGISAGHDVGRQLLFLNGTLGRDYYARNTALDRSRANVSTGVQWALSRCGGRVQGDYSTRQSSSYLFDDNLPSTQDRLSATVGATCRVSGRLSANAGYDWYKTANGLEARRVSNSRGHGLVAGLSYPIANRGSLSVSGFWRTVDYPNQLLLTGEANQIKYSGFSVGGGYRLGPTFSMNGSIGRTKADYRDPLVPNFNGTTWSAGLNYTGQRIGATVSAGRSASASGGSANFSVSENYTGTVRYRLGDRIGTSLGYTHNKADNQSRVLIPGEGLTPRSRKRDTILASVDYRLPRIFHLAADYRHEKQAAQLERAGYSTNIYSLTLSASF
jgi:hypothetical protein